MLMVWSHFKKNVKAYTIAKPFALSNYQRIKKQLLHEAVLHHQNSLI